MKKTLINLVLSVSAIMLVFFVPAAVVEGCAQQPLIPTNAIAAAQTAAQTAATVVSDAEAAWPMVKSLLPPDAQEAAQSAFDKAIFTANHTILALNDAISVATAANNPNPDFSTLLSQLGDAVTQIVDVVDEFRGKSAPSVAKVDTSTTGAFVDMRTAAAKLKSSK